MNTFIRLCISLFISLPISAYASGYLTDKVEATISWGYWYIFLGALLGGIASTFIKTEVDERLSHDNIAKLIIGTALGFFACITYIAFYPDTTIMKLALPSFVLGCLGAPIVVFLLTWASDPKTFKRGGHRLDKALGLEDKEGDD